MSTRVALRSCFSAQKRGSAGIGLSSDNDYNLGDKS